MIGDCWLCIRSLVTLGNWEFTAECCSECCSVQIIVVLLSHSVFNMVESKGGTFIGSHIDFDRRVPATVVYLSRKDSSNRHLCSGFC